MEKPNYKGLNPAHRQRIIAFEQAVRAHDNMGAQHPADHAAIEENLGYCRDQLVQTITKLYGKTNDKPEDVRLKELAWLVINEMSDPSPELSKLLIKYTK